MPRSTRPPSWPQRQRHERAKADDLISGALDQLTDPEIWAQYLARGQSLARYSVRNQLLIAAKIRAMFGDERSHMPDHVQSDYRTEIDVSLGSCRGGWVKMHGNGSEVEFERFRVPADVALAMLAAVAADAARPT